MKECINARPSMLCMRLKQLPEEKMKKNSGLSGIRNHDLWYAGALLYQLSYQANWELVIK